MSNYKSVTDFGAIGNYNFNTNTGFDNTPAFQQAINQGGTIFVPAGNYLLNSTTSSELLVSLSGVSLIGEGSGSTTLIFNNGMRLIVGQVNARADRFTMEGFRLAQVGTKTEAPIWVRNNRIARLINLNSDTLSTTHGLFAGIKWGYVGATSGGSAYPSYMLFLNEVNLDITGDSQGRMGHGMEIETSAGGLIIENSAIAAQTRILNSYGLYLKRGNTAARLDGFIMNNSGFFNFDINFLQDNTRLTNTTISNCRFDEAISYGILMDGRNPDATGAGCELVQMTNINSYSRTAAGQVNPPSNPAGIYITGNGWTGMQISNLTCQFENGPALLIEGSNHDMTINNVTIDHRPDQSGDAIILRGTYNNMQLSNVYVYGSGLTRHLVSVESNSANITIDNVRAVAGSYTGSAINDPNQVNAPTRQIREGADGNRRGTLLLGPFIYNNIPAQGSVTCSLAGSSVVSPTLPRRCRVTGISGSLSGPLSSGTLIAAPYFGTNRNGTTARAFSNGTTVNDSRLAATFGNGVPIWLTPSNRDFNVRLEATNIPPSLSAAIWITVEEN